MLIQSAISRLAQFFPDKAFAPLLAEEYNRVTTIEYERIRDFLILHYTANGREGEPFWDAVRSMALPDTLVEKMKLFEESGVIVKEEGELFTEEGWTQVMVGQGIEPRSCTPLTAAIDTEELGGFLKSLAQAYEQRALALPTHEEWLDHVLASPAQAQASAIQ